MIPRSNTKTNPQLRPDSSDGEIVFASITEPSRDAGSTGMAKPSTVTVGEPASPVGAVVKYWDVVAEENYFSFDSLRPFPHVLKHPLRAGYWIFEVTFGIVSLFAFLALLAAIPVVNVLALG